VFASGAVARRETSGSRGVHDTEAFAGVSYFLGPFTTASVSYQRTEAEGRGSFELQKSLPPGPGIGYRLSSQDPDGGAANGLVQYQTSYGRYEAAYDRIDGNGTTTLSGSGGVVFMGGGIFFSRPLEESFALLQVPGVHGVGGYLNNQRAGETDRRGNLLVPNLLPYYGNRLSIADQDVPMDRVIDSTEEVVAPPPRGGALVRFPVRRIQGVRGKLWVSSADGFRRIPSYGELVVDLPAGEQISPIGKEGDFYLENVPPGEMPARVIYEEGICEFLLEVPASDAALIQLGSVVCVSAGKPGPS
jgi:outer membrane usher protein